MNLNFGIGILEEKKWRDDADESYDEIQVIYQNFPFLSNKNVAGNICICNIIGILTSTRITI